MKPEGPSAPTSEDRFVKTVIRLGQFYAALDRPKSTPEETRGTWTGRPTTRTGALARAEETRRLQPPGTGPGSLAGLAGLAGVLRLVAGADNFK